MGGWDSKLAGEIGAGQGSQFSAGIRKHCVCWGDGVTGATIRGSVPTASLPPKLRRPPGTALLIFLFCEIATPLLLPSLLNTRFSPPQ